MAGHGLRDCDCDKCKIFLVISGRYAVTVNQITVREN